MGMGWYPGGRAAYDKKLFPNGWLLKIPVPACAAVDMRQARVKEGVRAVVQGLADVVTRPMGPLLGCRGHPESPNLHCLLLLHTSRKGRNRLGLSPFLPAIKFSQIWLTIL